MNDELNTHLYGLELRLHHAEVRGDALQLRALLADDFVEFASSGGVWNKAQVIEALLTQHHRPLGSRAGQRLQTAAHALDHGGNRLYAWRSERPSTSNVLSPKLRVAYFCLGLGQRLEYADFALAECIQDQWLKVKSMDRWARMHAVSRARSRGEQARVSTPGGSFSDSCAACARPKSVSGGSIEPR